MATDSTLQKIADNLLAQFDKTLLDNSTDFSSCDQILNAAPSEHKGGLESLYCDLLLDALISGYYRYSEMDTNLKMENPHLAFSLRAPSTSGWHGATERKRTVSRKKNTIGSHLRLFLSAKIP